MTTADANERPSVRVRRLPHGVDVPLPAPATSGSAGHDVCSAEADFVLLPGARRAVGTGLVFELPLGIEMQVRPRSGLALKHGITVLNAPGLIDSGYRGEIRVVLLNTDPRNAFTVEPGMRIAQLVIAPVAAVRLLEVDELAVSERGGQGFGSSAH